ncbi:Serine/threonine-protein kinase SIK3 [Gossypium australe]|uniref:Serine/threonine-protein kinase SIK3 n=1 Tax=Gossypium australe TaxID=47621 RepID=A0A5B6U4H8_9ROSI|nr:Serine/threonine-protein kinase SIK3 [Gossypium australe]
MTGGSLGVRTWSYGTLPDINGVIPGDEKLLHSKSLVNVRKNSTKMFSGFREKERSLPSVWCRCLGCRKISMLLLIAFALLVFVLGSLAVDKETISLNVDQQIGTLSMVLPYVNGAPSNPGASWIFGKKDKQKDENYLVANILNEDDENRFRIVGSKGASVLPSNHPCTKFTFPPPPPPNLRRIGPRPCPVCYLPVDQAIASMPSSPSASPVLQNLTYVHDENPIKTEPHGGSDFGGYPSIKQRSDSFDVKESMTVHCGFVKRSKPGLQTGFDFDESDLAELQQFHDIIVASAIFGNYDVIQQPRNVSEEAKKNIPFYMFIDEETEAYVMNKSILDSSKRVGLWRIVVVRNVPYSDARRNGKLFEHCQSKDEKIRGGGGDRVPKLLLHRIFPNVRYSIWIDGKLQLVVDPYQILEKFLWRQNANFAISRHYRRFDVFVEAEANKAAGKYDNSSIDEQVDFYKQEGLTPYSEAKFPITSDVPEGCVLIKEHLPITNLFTCLWFNEVDRFTSRDQLSFAIVRDKIMAKVDWNINMFLDCERRNFVIQTYHRDLLEQMPPPVATVIRRPPALPSMRGRTPGKRITRRRSSSRRHRRAAAGSELRVSIRQILIISCSC